MNLITAFRLNLNPAHPDVVSFVGGGGKTSTLFRLANAISHGGKRVITTTTTHMAAAQTELAPAPFFVEEAALPLAQIEAALQQHGHCLLVGSPVDHGSMTHGPDAKRVSGLSHSQIAELLRHAQSLQLSALLVEADGSRHKPVKAPGAHEPVVPPQTTLLVPVLGLDGVGRTIDEHFMHRPERVRALVAADAGEPSPRLTPARAAHLLVHPSGGAKQLPAQARLLPLLNKADLPGARAMARLVAQQLAAMGQPCVLAATGAGVDAERVERWAPTAVAILAAGRSSRMGRPKQVEVVDGEPMVVRAVRVALQSTAQHVLVVTGAHATGVNAALNSLAPRAKNLQIVHNPHWAQGQSTSMLCALDALPPQVAAVTFLPVDQPFVPPVLLRRLLQRWRAGCDLVVPGIQGKPRGAPALFDCSVWPELKQISGDTGGRPVIHAHRSELDIIPVSAKELFDIDTPADLPPA